MTEGDPGVGDGAGAATAGEMLRSAREGQGLSLDEVSARTRVPVRHLEAIEAGAYAALPSPTYAVGFARAHARATGADDVAVAAKVRAELAKIGPRKPEYMPYEMADPARVPSRGIAIIGLGVALGLLIIAALWFGSARFAGSSSDEGATPANAVVAAVPAAPSPALTPSTGGQVTLAATDEVWLRVYDAEDATLFIGTMKPGDRFDVPSGARDPKINVGRPDKLTVTLNGSVVPPLGTGERPIKDVAVSGEAIARRISGAPAQPSAGMTGPETSGLAPLGVAAGTAAVVTAARRRAPTPAARPRRALTETQRANLASAAQIRRLQRR
jgi:transcriptional regulator with XRE-family HTH domain